jgi:hypothetical protein
MIAQIISNRKSFMVVMLCMGDFKQNVIET